MNNNVKQIIVSSLGRQKKSNCFLPLDIILQRIENGIIDIIEKDNVVLLIEKKVRFIQLYYFLRTPIVEDQVWLYLSEELQQYPNLSLHIVNKEQETDSVVAKKLGFSYYKTYIRQQLINKDMKRFPESLNVEWAVKADREAVFNLVYQSFDVLADNLVDKPELEKMICDQHVLKIGKNDELQGILIFEDTGIKSYIRAICVASQYQKKGIGYSLLAKYWNDHLDNIRLFYLWVDKEKAYVINMYEKVGYKSDGLINHIYVRKKDS